MKISKRNGSSPGYTSQDVSKLQAYMVCLPYGQNTTILPCIQITFYSARHILGSAMVLLIINGIRVLFTGDFHIRNDSALKRIPIKKIFKKKYDAVISEATYGTVEHKTSKQTAIILLCKLIIKTYERGGICLIPCFTIGRPYDLVRSLILAQKAYPKLPIFFDGAIKDLLKLHMDYPEYLESDRVDLFHFLKNYTTFQGYSTPGVIISPSGMMIGPCVKHYINLCGNSLNSIALVGFQAPNTTGWYLKQKPKQIVVNHNNEPTTTTPLLEVHSFDGFSAHAPNKDLLYFFNQLNIKKLYIVHSDKRRAISFARKASHVQSVGYARALKNLETIRLNEVAHKN